MNKALGKTGLLEFSNKGLYIPSWDAYIDPWYPVHNAIITHAHADHSRYGMGHYLAHHFSEGPMRARLGQDIKLQTVEYGEVISKNGVSVTLIPAGHIIGSAQVLVANQHERILFTGDFKTEHDPSCTAWEIQKVDVLITECTFGLPIFHWEPQQAVISQIQRWWQENAQQNKTSILLSYALGKAQRLIHALHQEGDIFVHGAVDNMNSSLAHILPSLQHAKKVEGRNTLSEYSQALIITTPSGFRSSWVNKFKPFSSAMASGWMQIRGNKARRDTDAGFVLSDHADWNGLNYAVSESNAGMVYTTHGYSDLFAKYLTEKGIQAEQLETQYGEVEDAD